MAPGQKGVITKLLSIFSTIFSPPAAVAAAAEAEAAML